MSTDDTKIAIVGMAGRFPGARTIDDLWASLIRTGRDAIEVFDVDDGKVGFGIVDGGALFDAEFFDVAPAAAQRIKPEHRLFLEYTWKALESAGIDPHRSSDYISVYASESLNTASHLRRILAELDDEGAAGAFDLMLGNAPDSLATRVAYKLGLRGECMTVQTHCSSSLLAVHMACQSLLSGQSDVAIAGGVSLRTSLEADREHEIKQLGSQSGFILSADGTCRALLSDASGTVGGDGVGIVVLKPLADAIEDRNTIFAVIPGSAINNDGRQKVGFTAPSVDGVTGVIADALAFADLDPSQIGYLECHGTGTDLGDAIEVRAIRKVFEPTMDRRSEPLQLGSLKSNIGHLGGAAGIAGLIKAIVAVKNGEIPPLAHAAESTPHPEIETSEVVDVSSDLHPWSSPSGAPRRAGVSSLGIGGTNVHVLVEEAPEQRTPDTEKPPAWLLPWSGRGKDALEAMTRRLQAGLEFRGDQMSIHDVAHTLQHGRSEFEFRRFVVAQDVGGALDALRRAEFPVDAPSSGGIAFMFSGYGADKPGMAADWFRADPDLINELEPCAELLNSMGDFDLISYLRDSDFATKSLHTGHKQAAVIALEIAMANRYRTWGIEPASVIGSSLGEYAAACVAGGLPLKTALTLVFERGRLFERVLGGAMTLVYASMETLNDSADLEGISEAIRISESQCVVSGTRDDIQRLETELDALDHAYRRMPVEIAAHSVAVEPMRDDYLKAFDDLEFGTLQVPCVSNLTGEFLTQDDVESPDYWFAQMRNTVLFSKGLRTLYESGARGFFEVGPGRGLTRFADQNFSDEPVLTHASFTHSKSDLDDWHAVLGVVGSAWTLGASIDWGALNRPASIVQLPTYPFQRGYYYLGEPIQQARSSSQAANNADHDSSRVFARSPREELVTQIWSEILGVSKIGIDENFFDLGGDSLQATRVLGRLQADFTPLITVEDVMERRTIRGISELLVELLGEEGDVEESHYCSFEIELGGERVTVHMTREDFDEQGLPDGAVNIRILE